MLETKPEAAAGGEEALSAHDHPAEQSPPCSAWRVPL
jgi:hypothetical protein